MATTAPSSRHVQIDGRSYHYLDWGGAGTPVVMLHGFSSHAHTWDHTAAALHERYRVLALDQRGHGDTDWAPRYGSRPMVDDVLAFVDAVGLDRIVLMGLSMGGINAFLFAAANPVRVERLVILDIGPEVASAGTQRIMASIAEADVFTSEEEAIAQARAANPRPTDEILRHRVVHTLRPLSDGTFTFKWDKALRDGSAVRDDHGVDERWEAWRSITCPILLVRGADSDILSPDTAERMMKENPNATLAVVPDCGHSITLDRPDGFLEVLAPWLDEYNQRSASASG